MSFLKAANYQDGHAGYSNPLDEQAFITHYINELQNSPEWDSTAVVIAYDDSDGWYDHKAPEILNGSADPHQDKEICTAAAAKVGIKGDKNGQCGPGPRQPLLVVSPYAKTNHIDSTYTEQTSVTKFIQDNWGLGRLGGDSFDDRAGALTGSSVERVDDTSRAGTNLKPVVDGMNDTKVTEQGVPAVTTLDKAQQPDTNHAASGSSKAGIIGILAALGIAAGIIGWFMSGHPGLDLKNLPF